MKFKAGDKVRIKSWEEIKKTLDIYNYCGAIWFNPDMKKLCGKEVVLQLSKWGTLTEGKWDWAEDWLEPLPKTEKAVLVRGMTEYNVRRLLGGRAKSITTVEVPKSALEIAREIDGRKPTFNYHVYGNTTIAVDRLGEHVGTARRNTEDDWNGVIGCALAKARAMKWDDLEQELLAAL